MTQAKQYDKRDIMAQGGAYTTHIGAMTRENLFSKSDIAAELAHRDILLAQAEAEVAGLKTRLASFNEAAALWIQDRAEQLLDDNGKYRAFADTLIEGIRIGEHVEGLAHGELGDLNPEVVELKERIEELEGFWTPKLGAEAEELRAGIEEILRNDMKRKPTHKALRDLLDDTDARDSLRLLQALKKPKFNVQELIRDARALEFLLREKFGVGVGEHDGVADQLAAGKFPNEHGFGGPLPEEGAL